MKIQRKSLKDFFGVNLGRKQGNEERSESLRKNRREKRRPLPISVATANEELLAAPDPPASLLHHSLHSYHT